ncbi:MAG: MinD/ParA family protein [Phycisphaerales bacterium]|nr:MinD/ParA family protein [Phycisphaerales bacterium]
MSAIAIPPEASRPRDQAWRLRALVEALSGAPADAPSVQHRRAPIVAVASGKGGVGKTNLAVNLAVCLTRVGHRVTLLDADLGMANADVLCGLAPGRRLDDVLLAPRSPGAESVRLESCVVEAPGGFLLIPGAIGVARVAELDAPRRAYLLSQLAGLSGRSDLVLVDTGAGIGREVLAFADAADLLLVVATPEPTSIADAYGLMKCVVGRREIDGDRRPRIGLVVSGADGDGEAHRVSAKLAGCCERFLGVEVERLGHVRADRHVPRAVRKRSPHTLLWPRCPASRDVLRIAIGLAEAVRLQPGN